MKLLALALALFIAGLAFSEDRTNSVLLLIQPTRASHLKEDATHPGPWVIWPPAIPGRANPLLSIPTGVDWAGDSSDYRYEHRGTSWTAVNWQSFRERGDLARRLNPLELLRIGKSTTTNALTLCLQPDSPRIQEFALHDTWPLGATMAGEARDWDEVEAVRRSTRGRIMVAEYPPVAGETTSRVWLLGSWEANARTELPLTSTGIPGLVPARDLLHILRQPDQIAWTALKPRDNAATWAEERAVGTWFTTLWGVLITVAIAIGTFATMRERRSMPIALALDAAMLSPAAMLFSARLCVWAGLDAFVPLMIVSTLALTGTAHAIRLTCRRIRFLAHDGWSIGLIGTLVCLLIPPTWSPWNAAFAARICPTSPEAVAAFLGYLVTFSSLGDPTHKIGRWLSVAPVFAGAIGMAIAPWYAGLGLPVFVLSLAGTLLTKRSLVLRVYLAVGGASAGMAAYAGYQFRPGGLAIDGAVFRAIDSEVYLRFLLSPAYWTAGCLAALFGVFGDRFLLHQFHRLTHDDPERLTIMRLATAASIVGAFHPWFLFVALYLGAAGYTVLLRDALVELG